MKPNLIVHGGAWDWPDSQDEAKRHALVSVITNAFQLFDVGLSAMDVVEAAVRMMEDLPMFDAGTGGYLNREGEVELDALFVDGTSMNFGAVAGVTRVRNPITLARRIMDSTDQCFMIGEGAHRIASKCDLAIADNRELHTPHMAQLYEAYKASQEHDTVGAIAIDAQGNMAVGTSTSGSPVKPAGRVGDSPLYGSGGYADNRIGAAAATGKGENIMRLLLSKYACDRMATGQDASSAAKQSIAYANARFELSMCGLLTMDPTGIASAWHSTPKMAIGTVGHDGVPQVGMKANDVFLAAQ